MRALGLGGARMMCLATTTASTGSRTPQECAAHALVGHALVGGWRRRRVRADGDFSVSSPSVLGRVPFCTEMILFPI